MGQLVARYKGQSEFVFAYQGNGLNISRLAATPSWKASAKSDAWCKLSSPSHSTLSEPYAVALQTLPVAQTAQFPVDCRCLDHPAVGRRVPSLPAGEDRRGTA